MDATDSVSSKEDNNTLVVTDKVLNVSSNGGSGNVKNTSQNLEEGTVTDPKKSKLESEEEEEIAFHTFEGFQFKRILSSGPEYKRAVLEGIYAEKPTIIILEKKPFAENSLQELLSENSKLTRLVQNDIYGNYDCLPIEKESIIKSTIIHPATEKHILKYLYSPFRLVEETPELYEKVILPHITSSSFSIDWVYNLLSHKKEAERIVFEDPDKETGFILAPDLKWDGIQLENLYLSAIVHARGIKSIRDLNESHLPILENILNNGTKAIKEKYGLTRSQLRIYFHYHPSYYHLHVHFTSLQFNTAGTYTEKAHLIQSVISNIRLNPTYYQQATLAFTVKESDSSDSLYRKLIDYGYEF